MSRISWVALTSIVISIAILFLKLLAFYYTGSVAFYSDALESIINVVAGVATFIAVRVSAVPPDQGHPYGHAKAEYVAAVLQGVFIVMAAIFIVKEAAFALYQPKEVELSPLGVSLNISASVINGVWAYVLARLGRLWLSPALVADSKHLWSDVVSSMGVLVGIGLVVLTGWVWLDAVLGLLIGLHVLWAGYEVMKESMGGLMDESAPETQEIKKIIEEQATGAIQAHELRARRVGVRLFVEFHLVVPGNLTVVESHAICDQIEKAILEHWSQTVVTIHVEPENLIENEDVIEVSGS